MRNKITETEYKMMSKWRDWYGWQDSPSLACQPIPIKDVLEEWEASKSNLYTLLGDNLTLTKEICFDKSFSELRSDMYNIFDKYSDSDTRIDRQGWKFLENFKAWYEKAFPIHHSHYWDDDELTPQQIEENEINIPIREGFSNLICYQTLAENVYSGFNFTITLPNNKPYIIRTGCKPMRPLAKIAEVFNIEGFEDFRICHSQVLNQKTTKGTLSLSIHPFDYWTMSDNECGWESCMSWSETGGYRQGTVEMMNSPCVVVAYLNASEPMIIGNPDWKWNNKKWRCLFIVDKDVILSIKGYPYKNEELTMHTIKWLKELAEKNMGWTYWQKEPAIYKHGTYFINPNFNDENECFKFSFHSNNMYNDIGSDNHLIYVGEHLRRSVISKSSCYPMDVYYYNYSGASQCISCGEIGPSIDGESCLVCDKCESVCRCHECGERVWEDSSYWVGDTRLCECCYDNLTARCEQCEDDFFDEDINSVKILIPINEDIKAHLEEVFPLSLYEEESLKYKYGVSVYETTWCDQCLREFMKNNVKPDGKLVQFRNDYGHWYYGIYINDIVDEEKEYYLPRQIYDAIKRGESHLDIVKKYCNRYDYMKIRDMQENKNSYFYADKCFFRPINMKYKNQQIPFKYFRHRR